MNHRKLILDNKIRESYRRGSVYVKRSQMKENRNSLYPRHTWPPFRLSFEWKVTRLLLKLIESINNSIMANFPTKVIHSSVRISWRFCDERFFAVNNSICNRIDNLESHEAKTTGFKVFVVCGLTQSCAVQKRNSARTIATQFSKRWVIKKIRRTKSRWKF